MITEGDTPVVCFIQPAVTDESQIEVIVKPVPRPRTKKQPKEQSNDGESTADPENSVSNTTNGDVS